MNNLLLFDIDGTLLHVAEEVAFLRAFQELYGNDVDISWPADVAASDTNFIAAVVRRRVGRAARDDELAQVVERFVHHLENGIVSGLLPVRPVAGAPEFLADYAASRPLAVATGCVEPSARIKLRHAGIEQHFPCGGFSSGETRRAEILLRAIAAAERHYGQPFSPSQIVSFGDGPWDVQAARELGLRFIGINESDRGRRRLQRAGAATVLRDFTDTTAIERALQTAGK